MLSHTIASKQANKDEGQSNGRKTSSLRPPEEILKCPRCDSPNTKFCYYNNYSLTQPRHFCKACRRYWTKGGALRSVPIGGSCRKNKKTTSCNSSRFYGLSTLDFQLGGLNLPPRVANTNQLFTSSYGDTSSKPSFVDFDPLGFNFPFSSSHTMIKQGDHHHQQQQQQLQLQLQNQSGVGLASFHEMGTSNHVHLNNDLASSIESLSSINQDLHWKLQQKRLAMLLGGENDLDQQKHKKQVVLEPQAAHKLQPILFQNLETPKPLQLSMDVDSRKDTGSGSGLATEWFFDNSFGMNSTNSNSAGNDQNGNINNWNGIQTWNHLNN